MIYEERIVELDYSKVPVPKTDHDPLLKVFVPNMAPEVSKYTPDRPTVLILPGGAYSMTSEREAEPIALRFLASGANAAILYYSCDPARFPLSMLEALSALAYLRENAEKWNADRDKIYVCGFSAGGHLAASVGTLWNGKESKAYFGDTEKVKPNGLILAYPVIINDFDGNPMGHLGSFKHLLGDKYGDKTMMEYLCLDRRVSRETPPTFIWSSFEDSGVPCDSTLRFATALKANGIPFEMHIYEKGTHGKSTGDRVSNSDELRLKNWLNEACAWLHDERSAYIDINK